MSCSFVPDPVPRFLEKIPENSYLFIFRGKEILMTVSGKIPTGSVALSSPVLCVGRIGDICCLGADPMPPEKLDGKFEYREARLVLHGMDESMRYAASRARELVLWRKCHKFCGKCGTLLTESAHDEGLVCPSCSSIYYPQLAPAVITAVRNGNRVLLAHNRNFKGNIHSLIAGFVEAGETVEQAVVREIREEAGIEVRNVRYLYSQSWPFPNSLMLGFVADYASGTLTPDGTEIDHLDWYTRDTIPEIPAKGSIARRILDEIFSLDA